MGFLDYAWAISLQKDELKTRICLDPKLQQPTLTRDDVGFNITLPTPAMMEEGRIFFLGYEFQGDPGKISVGRLFRACVLHLTAHTLIPHIDEGEATAKRTLVEAFSQTLTNDTYVNTYIAAKHPDRLADLAYANSIAFAAMKPAGRIFNPATRIMTALLSKVNVGIPKGELRPTEEEAVNLLTTKLYYLKERIMKSLDGKETQIGEAINETANDIAQVLESHGPILEAPSLPYTEQIGPCTVFSQRMVSLETQIETAFRKSLETLSGTACGEPVESCWRREVNVEALQALDSWLHQKAREQKILARVGKYIEGTRFKSVEFPEEDHTRYMRSRVLLQGGSRRLLDSLRVAQDALDEDPRKEVGQLDLTEVIQKIASSSPRTDVFMENEYLSRSFAWGILFDASASMKINSEHSRALAICVAEATKELLMDPNSWFFYAFNDRFHILKDASEAYSHRVRSRIGGLEFDGLTYMPDAIRVAGKVLSQRFDEQRFLIVLSDGWPYGYPDMPLELSEAINSLQKKGIIVIGVGLESEKMNEFFKESCSVYNQKDLIKKFANLYLSASTTALDN